MDGGLVLRRLPALYLKKAQRWSYGHLGIDV
jgi:hypothetical protein